MRVITGVLLSLLISATVATAEMKYVNDRLEITVRSGPGVEYRILRSLPTGTKVEILETRDNWSRVRLSGGLEGWVLSRYLSETLPASQKYAALKEKCEPLEKQLADLKSENQALKAENRTLSNEIAGLRQELSETKERYDELEASSTDYLTLKSRNEELTAQLKEKNQKIESLETKISDSFLSEALKWFLSGAGVLLIGIIIGAANKRKRSSSLL